MLRAGTRRSLTGVLPKTDGVIRYLPHVDGVLGSIGYCKGGNENGRKVVCIHGCPGSVKDFRYLSYQLEEQGDHVLRIDLPGNGSSREATCAKGYGNANLASVVLSAVADVFGSQHEITVIAHSLGSHIAFEMALLNPKLITNIILIAPAGVEPHRALALLPWSFVQKVSKQIHVSTLVTTIMSYVVPFIYYLVGFPSLPNSEVLASQKRIGHLDFDRIRETIKTVGSKSSRPRVVLAYSASDQICREHTVLCLGKAVHQAYGVGDSSTEVLIKSYPDGGHSIQKFHAADIAKISLRCA